MKVGVSYNFAFSLIQDNVVVQEPIFMDIKNCLGFVAAEDVFADEDFPFCDISSRDGFAVSSRDVIFAAISNPIKLCIRGSVFADGQGASEIKEGFAYQVMTGAPVMSVVDCVLPIEYVDVFDDYILVKRSVNSGDYIKKRGIDFHKGDRIVKKGCRIRPVDIGICAALGVSSVKVFPAPRISIISTGDELFDPSCERKSVYASRDSNSYLLAAQSAECGCPASYFGIVSDDKEKLEEIIVKGLCNDVLLISGGMSKGNKDFVLDVLSSLGADIKFWWVKIKPGRPFAFATLNKTLIFCLPGTPCSAFVVFEKFIRPALFMMMGHVNLDRRRASCVLSENVFTNDGRTHFFRVVVNSSNEVSLAKGQMPVLLNSLINCDGILTVPEDCAGYLAGDNCFVEMFE